MSTRRPSRSWSTVWPGRGSTSRLQAAARERAQQEHAHRRHDDGPREPAFHPLHAADQNGGTVAEDVARAHEDTRPQATSEYRQGEETRRWQAADSPEQHAGRVGAVEEA